jgi:hypothetical protein
MDNNYASTKNYFEGITTGVIITTLLFAGMIYRSSNNITQPNKEVKTEYSIPSNLENKCEDTKKVELEKILDNLTKIIDEK